MSVVNMKKKSNTSPSDEHRRQRDGATHLIMFQRMIPNLITLTAMAAGVNSIQHAIHMEWEKAILALLVAMVLDVIDGATARLLKATSDLGAQLDSLSDFLAFGVTPAIILYIWALEQSGKGGWIATLFYISATALRLARFNIEQKSAPKAYQGFFVGVPSPAGAGLVLLPVVFWLQFPAFFSQFSVASPLIALWTMFIGTLMVSRIPTFSIKTIRLPAVAVMPVMAFAALLIAGLFTMTWQTFTLIGLAYIASLPFAFMKYKRVRDGLSKEADTGELPL